MKITQEFEVSLPWTEMGNKASVNNQLLADFINFKDKNELKFCTFHQYKCNDRKTEVVWCLTTRYNNEDMNIVYRDFEKFCKDNADEHCQISKMTCQENMYIVEYSIYRTYSIHYINPHKKDQED